RRVPRTSFQPCRGRASGCRKRRPPPASPPSSVADRGTRVCSTTPSVVSSLPNASVGCRILFKSLFCGGLGRLQDRPTPERLYGSTLYHSVAPAWRRRPIGTVGRRRLRSAAPGGRRQRAIAVYRAKRR